MKDRDVKKLYGDMIVRAGEEIVEQKGLFILAMKVGTLVTTFHVIVCMRSFYNKNKVKLLSLKYHVEI